MGFLQIEQLRRFIARLVYIGTLPAVGGSAPNVSDAASLVEALK